MRRYGARGVIYFSIDATAYNSLGGDFLLPYALAFDAWAFLEQLRLSGMRIYDTAVGGGSWVSASASSVTSSTRVASLFLGQFTCELCEQALTSSGKNDVIAAPNEP